MTNIKKLVTPEGTFEIEMTAEEISVREQSFLQEKEQAEIRIVHCKLSAGRSGITRSRNDFTQNKTRSGYCY